jgi:hypothetical protein
MHGRYLLRTLLSTALPLACIGGCTQGQPAPAPAAPLADAGTGFCPEEAGAIRGRVLWEGEVPTVSAFQAPNSPLSEHPGGWPHTWPNPHAPAIDPTTRGVGSAVVFLRGVDAVHGRPWDHPSVRVEQRDLQLRVFQGGQERTIGFVRRGTAVTFSAAGEHFQSLQARGAAFFGLTFPPGGQPVQRVLDRPGEVELSSMAGHFWMRGHLFVADHPYFSLTDAQGRFYLDRVPPGDYEVVCWHPSWKEAEHELDGDTALVCRLTFQPPTQVVRTIRLAPRASEEVVFRLGLSQFGR